MSYSQPWATNKMKKSNLVFLIVLVAIGAFFFYRYKVPHDIAFSDLHMTTSTGQQVRLMDNLGKPAIVHFYASWCGPCMKELPDAIAFAKANQDKYHFYFITDDPMPKMLNIMERFGGDPYMFYTIPSLNAVDVYSIPMTYFIDEKGEIKMSIMGECEWYKPNYINDINAYYN